MPFPDNLSPRVLGVRAARWVRGHRRLAVGGGIALLLLVLYPWGAGTIAAHLFASKVSERLGRPVTVEHGRAGFGEVRLDGVVVPGAEGGPALFSAERITIPFGAALGGRGPIHLRGARAHVVRGGKSDNVSAVLERLRGRGAPGDAGAGDSKGSGRTPPAVEIESGAIEVRDGKHGLSLSVAGVDGLMAPGDRLNLRLRRVRGLLVLAGQDRGPTFGAEELGVQTALAGMRPKGIPAVNVKGGYATPLPTLALTGIAGMVAPDPAQADSVAIDLHGSYGGARETLWTAKGHAQPARREGRLSVRAEQFSLDKIADVLPRSVLTPENTSLDAAFDVDWAGEAVRFSGDVATVGLSLQHDAIASDPVTNVSVGLSLRGTAYPERRRVELERVEARVRDLTARLSGSVELPLASPGNAGAPGMAGVAPRIDLTLAVPRLPCAKLLASIPEALMPRLQGFVLQGMFEATVHSKVDFAALDATVLEGKVGIDGCKVLKAPDDVAALAGPQSLILSVDVPPPPGAPAGDTETMSLVVGPDNPDFAPYDQISPYLVSSILTTEDNGFFKHRGWVTSEFKSALKRNLARGGFRLGASSITMQMTKNVLLSQEKTLSRKVQELFLVWYLEQVLPKERILELYFNAIEFGPRIYGIGAAARHYFGKKPADLNPLEAAFFSSILPSPKRRYIQYCHGTLFPPWDKYVHRILAKVHERGRIEDDEYVTYAAQPLVFDRSEASFTEKQCAEWVKTITARPEPEAPPELDEEAGDDGAEPWPQKKLRKLFVRGGARAAAASMKTPARRAQ